MLRSGSEEIATVANLKNCKMKVRVELAGKFTPIVFDGAKPDVATAKLALELDACGYFVGKRQYP